MLSTVVKCGIACNVLGLLTFWMLGLGFTFFSVAMVLSVVAMCTNQGKHGLLLLVGSMISMVLAGILSFLIMGAVAFGVVEAVAGGIDQQTKQMQLQADKKAAESKNFFKTMKMVPVDSSLDFPVRVQASIPDYESLKRARELKELRDRQGDYSSH